MFYFKPNSDRLISTRVRFPPEELADRILRPMTVWAVSSGIIWPHFGGWKSSEEVQQKY